MSTYLKYRNLLRGSVEKSSQAFPKIVKEQYPEVINFCNILSEKIGKTIPPLTIFKILLGVVKAKRCIICGKRVYHRYFYSETKGLFCSSECREKGKDILAKMKREGMIRKYGVDNCSKLKSVKEKKKQAALEKYGVENVGQAKEVKEKMKKTNLKRYGVEFGSQSEQAKRKLTETWKNKSEDERERIGKAISERILDKDKFLNHLLKYDLTLADGQEYYGQNKFYNKTKIGDGYRFRCLKCGTEFVRVFKNSRDLSNWCPKCNKHFRSSYEKELLGLFENLEVKVNDRQIIKPLELDIVVPEKKLAIEFNGIYWHSEENGKGQDYHINKTRLANTQGYDLIHVFEDEWWENKRKIISLINEKIGKKSIISLDKCSVVEKDNDFSKRFIEKYSINDKIGKKNICLSYNGRTVYLVSYDILKNKIKIRNKCGLFSISSVGMFNKVVGWLKTMYHLPMECTVDFRYFDEKEEIDAGFVLLKEEKPRKKRGIWDCGNGVFVLKNE